MITSKQLSTFAIAVAGLAAILMVSLPATHAQDAHHPPDATDSSKPDGTTKRAAPMSGMMGGDQVPMMKMMQEMHAKMMGGAMMMQPKGDSGPSSQAYHGIINKLRQSMDVTFTGNADADFIEVMIANREATLDLAKTVLAFGKDAEVKRRAEETIKSQSAEIDWSTEWLKNNDR